MHPLATIAYLEQGNERQQRVFALLQAHRVMELLQPFTPLLTGTIPLDIDIAGSDLDILCCCADLEAFALTLQQHFGHYPGFHHHATEVQGHPTVIAHFMLEEWPAEVFCQRRSVWEQEAWRHLVAEHRLLLHHGEPLRQTVRQLKTLGIKTEPSFAQALALEGDPYQVLLRYYPSVGPE